jgi:diguanylate cyclase (GGDEF)-like protein/PAS domain S-box-containing protein
MTAPPSSPRVIAPRQEGSWRQLVGAATGAVSIHGPDGSYRHVSDGIVAMLGYTADELVGTSPLDHMHPDDLTTYQRRTHGLAAGHDPIRLLVRRRRRDGSWAWTESTVHPVRDGEAIVEYVVISLDISPDRHVDSADPGMLDGMTGLPNRSAFDHRLRHLESPVSVLLLEVDGLDDLSDTLGHESGDHALYLLAQVLATVVPHTLLARTGGNEFVVVLTGPAAIRHRSQSTAAALLAALAEPLAIGNRAFRVGASVGIADWLEDGPQMVSADLYPRAKAALHSARALGRGRVVVWQPALATRAHQRMEAEQSLRRAMVEGGISVQYQPIVRINDRSVVAVEALVRLTGQDPALGAGPLLDAARDAGLLVEIDRIVLRTVLRDLPVLQQVPGPRLRVHVNVGVETLTHAGWVNDLAALSYAGQQNGPQLVIEVTEEGLLAAGSRGAEVLEIIRAAGHLIGLDDFGAGFTSLAMLASVPADILKLDRSLVTGAPADPRQRAVLAGALALARALGLAVVAEGVETEDEHQELVALGCDEGQGWLYGRPAALDSALVRPPALAVLVTEVRRITYTSHCARPLTPRELQDLLRASRARNLQAGVTGMLLHLSGSFLQVLEGESDEIERIWQSVQDDDRHTDLNLLADEPARDRLFQHWPMGYERPVQALLEAALPRYGPESVRPLADLALVSTAEAAASLLTRYTGARSA